MSPLVPPAFSVPVSERAERAIAWLERHVDGQYQGWCIDGSGMFAVDLLTGDEADRYLGETLEKALEKAHAAVCRAAAATAAVRLQRPSPARIVTIARGGEPAAFALARVLEAVDP